MTEAAATTPAASLRERLGPGTFVFVVGPSGAGKDTLLDHARRRLASEARVSFVRRVVTRQADDNEDNESLSEPAFAEAQARGAFALTWRAHGLSYGIPRDVEPVIAAGGVVVANGSRAAVAALRSRFAHVLVAEITASPEIRAARLLARGRETRAVIMARLARPAPGPADTRATVTIENHAAPEAAGERLVAAIGHALEASRRRTT